MATWKNRLVAQVSDTDLNRNGNGRIVDAAMLRRA